MNSSGFFMEQAFKSKKLFKTLMSLSMITILRVNPVAFAGGMAFNYGAVLLPLLVRN